MARSVELAKARRKLTVTANDRRVDAAARRRQKALEAWLRKLARHYVDKHTAALRTTKAGGFTVRKARDTAALEAELVKLLTKFGLRDINGAGADMAARLDGDWLVRPGLVDSVIRQKTVAVQNIIRDSERAVRSQLRKLLLDASKERPTPSVQEIARRIRKTYLGTPGQDPIASFSAGRASLIAQTEAVQSQNTGIVEGMKAADVSMLEWLAHVDGKSGDRHHERMNGKRVKMGEMFTTPLGNKLRYPGDPLGNIRETARCRCTVIPVIERNGKLIGGRGVRKGT